MRNFPEALTFSLTTILQLLNLNALERKGRGCEFLLSNLQGLRSAEEKLAYLKNVAVLVRKSDMRRPDQLEKNYGT